MLHRPLTVLLVLPGLVLSAVLSAQDSLQPLPGDRTNGASTIRADQLREWLTVLSSPEFGGRGTGQPGFQLAADYVKDHFKSLGLKPGAPGGKVFQPVPVGLAARLFLRPMTRYLGIRKERKSSSFGKKQIPKTSKGCVLQKLF